MSEKDLPMSLEQNDLLRLFRWHQLDVPGGVGCDVVAAGSYLVKTTSTGFLTTSLGSAVGLALYDRAAGVGGIASFLLANSSTGNESDQPENYVDTGLPLFIDKLRAAGADPKLLEAAVAGGSLQLRGGLRDEENQWCGLAADALLEQLSKRQIPVAAVDLGGVRPLSMLLDTRTWKASIELMEDLSPPSVKEVRPPSSGQIDYAISTTQPIPQIALKILTLLEGERDLSSLVTQIKQDQVITAKILRFSNSPLYNPGKEIASIERALVFLGENRLFEIAITSAISTSFDEPGAGYGLMKGGLYKHALAVAQVAKTLALETEMAEPGVAYTAGLLHDIGKIVLDRFVANALPFFYQHVASSSKDYAEIERELFDTDHLEVGTRLAQQWHLSEPLTEVITHHHWPERSSSQHHHLVHLIYLADLLSSCYLAGIEMESINTDGLEARLQTLGMPSEKLPKLIERVSWKNLVYL